MTSFIKWVLGVTIALAATGQLKPATLAMPKLAAKAHQHQMSYGKFSRTLTAPQK
jgi:hypothetical protein